jgi:serine/threonine protein kinase
VILKSALAEQLFEGTPNSAAFMAAVETDITNRLTSFGTDLVGICLELARTSGAPIGDDLETWVSQFFENYFVASATQFANSITDMRKLRHESADGVWDHINRLIFSGRDDLKIRFGRLKLQASREFRAKPAENVALKRLPLRKNAMEFETTFSRYSASEVIGEGGTGKVYKAIRDEQEEVAIKVLDPEKATSKERRGRFKNELLFGSKNRHPNIMTVVDHGVVKVGGSTTPFFVMPLYLFSLRDALKKGMTPSSILPAFSQILDGVEAAHLQQVIHRDLKPENILCGQDGKTWVVADFGVAEFAVEELYTLVETKPTTRLANFQYAAPEQRTRGGSTDARTDIFALGLILNEMFTGAIPHGTQYKTIASVLGDHGYLDDLVNAMMRHAASDRPASIDTIKQQLIARKNDFVERQRLSQLQNAVVRVSDVDDPLATEPVRVVDADWERGVLTLTLSHYVNADWSQVLQFGSYSKTSIMGKGPESFSINGNKATVHVRDDDVQRAIDFFKTWLVPTQQIYAQQKQRAKQQEEERQRKAVQAEIEEIERRRKVLSQIKI